VSVATALLVAAPRSLRPTAAIAVVALAGFELFRIAPNTGQLPYRGAAAAYDAAADVHERLRTMQGSDRVWIVRDASMPSSFAPKLATLHRVRSLDDYESITLRRQAELITYLLERRLTPKKRNLIFAGMLSSNIATAPLDGLPQQRRLLDLTATRLVLLTGETAASAPMRALVERLRLRPLAAPRSDVVLYENPDAVPRAYVAYRTETAPEPGALLARMADNSFDPLVTSYVEGPPLAPDSTAPPRGRAARILRDEDELIEIEATADAPGLLVLADSFYPGWRADVDGVEADIVAANHLFRGVALPPGTHRVRFVYRPASVAIGAAASLVGLLVLAGLLVFSWRGRECAPARA
jgi:ADP-ribose pyrophosphatase YjhB (NUDIX family)